jgi:hypothetical protein
MMFSLLLIFFVHLSSNQAAILSCDFETQCDDFKTDYYWGVTNGRNPRSIDHDHTLNTSDGHYLFYNNPSPGPSFQVAQIKTNNWLPPTTDRALCFRMWYYTPRISLPFTVQLVQGDDERLARIVASIHGRDLSSNDWALINVTLPAEKLGIYIRINSTVGPLAFDDLTVDYCDAPRPSPPTTLLQCDFESSCSNNWTSLPLYPYQWQKLAANEAIQIEPSAPAVDYTLGTGLGHYAVLPNALIAQLGKVGYLQSLQALNITDQQSFCLNFQYYGYGRSYLGSLQVYTMQSDGTKAIRRLWPLTGQGEYS